MNKRKKRYTKKSVHKAFAKTFVLVLFVCAFSYWVHYTEWYTPKINELSASYLSLNNNNATDMLKVSNLHKLSNNKGKSFHNPATEKFEISGDSKKPYQIVLYHIGNTLEDEAVHFYLKNNQGVEVKGTLSEVVEAYDGGKIVFQGSMEQGTKWKIKMWVDKDYQKEANNIAYEIRIKEAGEQYER